MKIYSWNVNSLRSCEENFIAFINQYQPDIVFIQELRGHSDQMSFFLKTIPNYKYMFNDSGRPGYSGTAVYYKESLDIQHLSNSVGDDILDIEGRLIHLKVSDINFFNFYIPNGTSSVERLELKMKYHSEIYKLGKEYIDKKEKIVILGDFNVGHTHKDLYKPDHKGSGFLPMEREWFDNMIKIGFLDAFRMFNKEGGNYTWWHLGDPKREKNNGWRFDYFLISNNMKDIVINSTIHKDVYGSDHCPIGLEMKEF